MDQKAVRGETTMGDNKLDLLAEMNASYGELTSTRLQLRLDGKDDEAQQIQERRTKLRAEIDRIRGKAAEDWAAKADALAADVKAHNETVQGYINDIKNNIETAQNVVKLVGAVDDLVSRVRSVIP